ncbi:hypothetical protein C6558_37715 [Ensifer sp. NM-2]|nr:hypothetical protein C6558_37715 [Ensifer sp. NM-2]
MGEDAFRIIKQAYRITVIEPVTPDYRFDLRHGCGEPIATKTNMTMGLLFAAFHQVGFLGGSQVVCDLLYPLPMSITVRRIFIVCHMGQACDHQDKIWIACDCACRFG